MRLAIIPARGGSKRIPGKNIRDFLGKPVIAYSIEAAIHSRQFDEVMVSTDRQEIREIALKYGANVPFMRSSENATDFATTIDVIREVISQYRDIGAKIGEACCIYPCAPFVKADWLSTAFETLETGSYDSIIPIVEHPSPAQRAFKTQNGKLTFLYPEYSQARTQDLPKTYFDPGQFYCFKVEPVLKAGALLTDNTGYLVLKENEVQDIDTLEDWLSAEFKYKQLYLTK